MMTTIPMVWIILGAQAADPVAQDKSGLVPERNIRVERIEEPLDTPVSRFDSLVERPRFAATIVLERGIGDTEALDLYRGPTSSRSRRGYRFVGGEGFRSETGMSGLSDAQIKLMKTGVWIEGHWFDQDGIRGVRTTYGGSHKTAIAKRFQRYSEGGTVFWTVYGVTSDDAIAVARAAVELIDAKTRKAMEASREALRQKRESEASVTERLSDAKKKANDAQNRLKQARKVMPYRNAEQAAADVAELAKSIRQAEIEIAGIRAKQKAIDAFRARKGIDDDARAMLDRKTMELDIELAGALARADSLQRHRGNAETFRDALVDRRNSAAETEKWTPSLRKIKQDLGRLISQVTNPQDDAKAVVLIDDKIIIQPIRYTE